jgi:hypothetical protein
MFLESRSELLITYMRVIDCCSHGTVGGTYELRTKLSGISSVISYFEPTTAWCRARMWRRATQGLSGELRAWLSSDGAEMLSDAVAAEVEAFCGPQLLAAISHA